MSKYEDLAGLATCLFGAALFLGFVAGVVWLAVSVAALMLWHPIF